MAGRWMGRGGAHPAKLKGRGKDKSESVVVRSSSFH